jgi:hypothetical protein
MTFLDSPFLWALISMFGLVGACAVVGSKRVGGRPLLGLLFVTAFFLGRFVLACLSANSLVSVLAAWSAFWGVLYSWLGACSVWFPALR